MKGFIYCIHNTINDKIYIGSTKEIVKRRNRHFNDLKNNKHCNVYLQRAYNKYGEDILDFFVLAQVEVLSQKELLDIEHDYILEYEPEYNIGSVGGGDNLSKHPNKQDIIKRRSKALKKYLESLTAEERAQKYGQKMELNGNWNGGKCYCSCGNKKSSVAKTCGKCRDRSGKNNPFFGRKHSEETKKKLSEANKGKIPLNARKIMAEGKLFNSIAEAARYYNLSNGTIHYRLNSSSSKWKDFQYFQQ